jgi:hypothetical protein
MQLRHRSFNGLTELHTPNITHKVFSSQPHSYTNSLTSLLCIALCTLFHDSIMSLTHSWKAVTTHSSSLLLLWNSACLWRRSMDMYYRKHVMWRLPSQSIGALAAAYRKHVTWHYPLLWWRHCTCAEVCLPKQLPRSRLHNTVVLLLHVGPCVWCDCCLGADWHVTIR